MLCEHGVSIDHSTIYRWVQRYAPEIEKRLRWYWSPGLSRSWRVDETYIKVKGKWTHMYRAVDEIGKSLRQSIRTKRQLTALRLVNS